jgi:hypothetical protein
MGTWRDLLEESGGKFFILPQSRQAGFIDSFGNYSALPANADPKGLSRKNKR